MVLSEIKVRSYFDIMLWFVETHLWIDSLGSDFSKVISVIWVWDLPASRESIATPTWGSE